MRKKPTTQIRVYPDIKDKLMDLSLELTGIQKERVSIPESLRRIANIPNLKNILIDDAKMKARLKYEK